MEQLRVRCPQCGATQIVNGELEACICHECGFPFVVEKNIIKDLPNDMEEAGTKEQYQAAIRLYSRAETIEDLNKVISELGMLGEYKNSRMVIERCHQKLEKLKAEKREEDSGKQPDASIKEIYPMIYCDNCGSYERRDSKYCSNCGNEIAVRATREVKPQRVEEPLFNTLYCPECGSAEREGSKYCSNCGTLLEVTETMMAEQPQIIDNTIAPEPDINIVKTLEEDIPMVYCSNCGSLERKDSRYCSNCGELIEIDGLEQSVVELTASANEEEPESVVSNELVDAEEGNITPLMEETVFSDTKPDLVEAFSEELNDIPADTDNIVESVNEETIENDKPEEEIISSPVEKPLAETAHGKKQERIDENNSEEANEKMALDHIGPEESEPILEYSETVDLPTDGEREKVLNVGSYKDGKALQYADISRRPIESVVSTEATPNKTSEEETVQSLNKKKKKGGLVLKLAALLVIVVLFLGGGAIAGTYYNIIDIPVINQEIGKRILSQAIEALGNADYDKTAELINEAYYNRHYYSGNEELSKALENAFEYAADHDDLNKFARFLSLSEAPPVRVFRLGLEDKRINWLIIKSREKLTKAYGNTSSLNMELFRDIIQELIEYHSKPEVEKFLNEVMAYDYYEANVTQYDYFSFGSKLWIVRVVDANYLTLVSLDKVDINVYDLTVQNKVWKDSPLYRFMNGEYYNQFTSEQKAQMVPISTKNTKEIVTIPSVEAWRDLRQHVSICKNNTSYIIVKKDAEWTSMQNGQVTDDYNFNIDNSSVHAVIKIKKPQ